MAASIRRPRRRSGRSPVDDLVQAVVEGGEGSLGLLVDAEELAVEGVAGGVGLAAGDHGDALPDGGLRIGVEPDADAGDEGGAEGGVAIARPLNSKAEDVGNDLAPG